MYIHVSQEGEIIWLLTLQISCVQPFFHIEMGLSPLTRKTHEEHNDTYWPS